ncbi:MAG TPA: TonB-dependent receptor [Acidisarcina sp.]|nr:TonB-dependent receptor [Acidisarcina sp.]
MTHKRRMRFVALLAILALALGGRILSAQSSVSGAISGTVSDSSGAVISGATVTLTNTDRDQVIRTLTTSSTGFYTAGSLPLGTYSVTVASPGFKTEVITGLALHVSDSLTVNRTLKPGEVTEVARVTADEARVNLEDATAAGLINGEQISEMPLITRNYESLINLQPGVAFGGSSDQLNRGPNSPTGGSSTVAFSINGGRTTSNNWTIDGADNLDRGANLTLYTYPSPDAIAEFKTLRGQYSAQFGRNASGQIDVVTKSGTNAIHGSAYEYLRNDYLDANGYYNNFKHIPITKYRYNDFGFSFGGPVYLPKIYNGKDKTFFFISEEWLRDITYSTGTAIVPTADERNGDFSNSGYLSGTAWTTGPINVCTAFTYNTTNQTSSCTAAGTKVTNISPAAQAYLKDIYSVIPNPDVAKNLAQNQDPHSLSSTISNHFNNLNTVVRIDEQVGQKLSVFYRYLHDTFPSFQGSGTFVAIPIPGLSATVTQAPGTQHLAHGTYVFSPSLIANLGYAYSNGSILTQPQGVLLSSRSKDINIALPYTSTVGVVPTIAVSGMTTLGGGVVYVDHGINHQVFGDVAKTWRNHMFTAGFTYNHYEKQENSAGGGNQGSFSFTNDASYPIIGKPASSSIGTVQAFANFLLGNANNGFSQSSRNIHVDVQSNLWEGFLQDDWKVRPGLTLNLGVRYSYFGQPFDGNRYLSNFDPSTYSADKAPTIAANGLMCFTGPCNQTGSNAGLSASPNSNADYVGKNYINGMIFGNPSSANNNQASPYGNKVGKAGNLNFSPRVGFSWDVYGNGKTALRGGYGLSYDQAEVSYYETTIFNNPPAVATYTQTNSVLDNPTSGTTSNTPSTAPGRIQGLPLNFQTPYVQQYSLDIQQQITPSFQFDIGYFGTHGTHLLGILEINQPKPGAWQGVVDPRSASSGCSTTYGGVTVPAFLNSTCDRVLNQIKPYLGYFAIDAMRSIFNSNYNALQAKITKRFTGKTYIDANYTWSRDLTNAQADYSGVIQNIYNINGEYGRAAVDRTHVFNMDGVFEEPFFRDQRGFAGRAFGGWEISAILSINSGLPLTISDSGGSTISYNLPGGVASIYNGQISGGLVTDNAGLSVLGNTNAGLRPNQIGDPNHGHGIKIHNKAYGSSSAPWFYTGAFAAPAPTSPIPGNARRGTIEGPGFIRLDGGIFRNFRIYERLNFQLRAEAFNALNHTNVNSVGTNATSSTFGQVTGYRDPRILQLAGKFTF